MLGREASLAEGGEEGVTRSGHVHLSTQLDECLVGAEDHCSGVLIHTGERGNVTTVTQRHAGKLHVLSFGRALSTLISVLALNTPLFVSAAECGVHREGIVRPYIRMCV